MRVLAIVVLAIMLLGAAGCSALSQRKETVVTDAEKVALVNAAARQRGVEVIWVNPPKKWADAQKESVAKN